ncbi:MAG: CbiX/SirB N-terminal domain-containing protein, partial [Pseudonocardiaceae bacterium]
PRAVAGVRAAASMLAVEVGRQVPVGFLAAARPRLPAVVDGLRAAGERRVAVASWLLAPGLFHRAASECGADVVADPLGTHPAVLARLTELAGSGCRHRAHGTRPTCDANVTGVSARSAASS